MSAAVERHDVTIELGDVANGVGLMSDGDWVESKDQDPAGDVRLIQLADVGVGLYLDKSRRFLTNTTAKRLGCTFLQPDDVLIARMPDPIGRACIFPGDTKAAVTVVDVCVVRPDPSLCDPRWLCWTLNAPDFSERVQSLARGATRQRVARSELAQLKLPRIPVSEQRRIAAILDQADALRAKRRTALAHLKDMAQSIFVEMFGDPVANEAEFPLRELKTIARVATGSTPASGRAGMFGDAVPFITPGDLGSRQPAKRRLTAEGASEARLVRDGSALVCCIGATIGKMDKARGLSAFNQQINAIEWGTEVDSEYGFICLTFLKSKIAEWGAFTTLPILKKSSFERIRVPVPHLTIQLEFASRIAAVTALIDANDAATDMSDKLFASLQYRAFRGEL